MHDSKMFFHEQELKRHLNEIAQLYSQKPKISLVIRCPWLPDGDMVISNDDPKEACNSMMNLARRNEKEKGTN